jgi:2-succinyl-6-hydroxy-2,4-cyclohexadiene-1-carboxylate synthase
VAILKFQVADGVTYELYDNNKKSSEALVFFHGFTGSADSWGKIEQNLKNQRIIRISLLGHGETDSPTSCKRYTAYKQAKDILAIFKSLKLHKVCLIGYSMGGRLALYFTLLYPAYVSKLVLESSSPGLKTLQERKARIIQDRRLADFIHREGLSKFVDYWEEIPLFESQKRLPSNVRGRVKTERLKNDPIGLANSLSGFGTGSQPALWGKLKDLKIPVLLIAGELDEKFCRMNREMEKTIESSNLRIVDQAGHTVHLESPEIFAKLIQEFVS